MSIYNRVTELERDVLAAQADATAALAPVEGSTIRVVTADDTLNSADRVLLVDASSRPITISLPAAATSTRKRQDVKKTDSSRNPVTLAGNGSETIEGGPTAVLRVQGESITVISDGLNRHIH